MEEIGVSCRCGKLTGSISATAKERRNHLLCYCNDCQAFGRFVGAEGTLDEWGGTDIVQLTCADVEITSGIEHLACVQLSEGGLHRWYAGCCNTPIGNAPGPGLPFIGVIHDCLQPATAIAETFGPVSMVAFPKEAVGEEKPSGRGLFVGIIRFIGLALGAKLRGDGRRHPFFDTAGNPRVTPRVLSEEERAPYYQA